MQRGCPHASVRVTEDARTVLSLRGTTYSKVQSWAASEEGSALGWRRPEEGECPAPGPQKSSPFCYSGRATSARGGGGGDAEVGKRPRSVRAALGMAGGQGAVWTARGFLLAQQEGGQCPALVQEEGRASSPRTHLGRGPHVITTTCDSETLVLRPLCPLESGSLGETLARARPQVHPTGGGHAASLQDSGREAAPPGNRDPQKHQREGGSRQGPQPDLETSKGRLGGSVG